MKWIAALIVAAIIPLTAWAQAPAVSRENPVPALMRNLNSQYVNVAASAARSLGVVFSPGGRGGNELEPVTAKLIENLSSPKGAVLRRECATALGRIQARTALDPLKEAIKDVDYSVAIAAANAIREILPVDEARVYLKGIAVDPSESIQVAAFDAMSQIAKPEDADFLLTGMDATNWRIQTSSIRGLERAVRAGARIKPEDYDKVAAMLGGEVSNTAEAALWFLAHTRNSESIRAAIAAVDTKGDGGPDDTSWRTRTYGIRTLYNMGWPHNRKGLPAVIRQLGDSTANVVNEAKGLIYYLLNEKKMRRQELFPLLLAELEKAEGDSLRAGIMAEMDGGIARHYSSRVAKIAAVCLNDAMTNKTSWQVRAHAINLLGHCENTMAIEQVATCVGDDVPNVRQAAGNALSRLASNCTEEQKAKVAPILLTYLTDTRDWRKTAIAANNAGYYYAKDAVAPLVKLLSHGVGNVKDGAARSLINLVDHRNEEYGAQVEAALLPEMEATDLAWEYGAKVLGPLQNAETIPLLRKILERGTWRAKENAARAVADIAAVNKISDKALNDVLIRNAQSQILQVQETSNHALKMLAK